MGRSRALRGGIWAKGWIIWPFILLGGLIALTFIVAPLEAEQQIWLAVAGFLLYMVANRIPGRGVTIFLVLTSCVVSLRYIYWRLVDTLDFTTFLQTFLGTGLILAEVYAIATMLLAYFQAIWPLERKPVPLPDDPEDWPVIDVFIPSYNEPLEIVKPAIYGALAMDWPGHKFNVYLLDDGRRDDFRRFCEEVGCGYIIRPDNKGAKAGNINHALSQTNGEFIAIFDCDHVATRAFLQLTVGWLLRDRDLCMVQTPHHFYSPDPFERNLASGQRVPNEGLLFYGMVQEGNDLWNATFFCGSCAVIRREALEEVGGVPTATVTEDCHCSLKMQRRGWRTAYLRIPLAAGLATERLMLHIGQRMRWGRGMIQIMRIENPLFASGLKLHQRFCYFMSQFHFLFPLARFVFLTAPLAFLLFGESIIAASPLAILVTAARLVLQGATSPALIPEYSQIMLALNEQFVGVINPDRNRPAFGPLEFPINPVFFADLNRMNFRFTGRYTIECNDPLSGLLWSNISDLSTLQVTLERLPLQRDLTRLPEPFFDPRLLREPLMLPVVVQDGTGNDQLKAAATVASWFAVQADYRGASFPVSFTLPASGNAVVILGGQDSIPGVALPRFEGPTVALVSHPTDPFGLLLVVGGRTGAEAAQAAQVLAGSPEALAGEITVVQAVNTPQRQPYDAPRWIRSDRPVRFGELVDPSELQAFGYAPGPIAIPFRTAPDLYTWRGRNLPVEMHYRAPPGPIMDVAVSRLDVAMNDIYLRSLPLRDIEPGWPLNILARAFVQSERQSGRFGLPPYLIFGMNELQFRFDMRPLHRGDCIAVPADVRATIDPDSTIDLTDAYRFTTLPNLAFFVGSGFPFTRMADFSETAVVLPDRPTAQELSAFLSLIGRLAANVGHATTKIEVVRAAGLESVAARDLLVIGPLGRQAALNTLLRDGPIMLDGNRIQVSTPDALEGFRNLFLGDEPRIARQEVQALLASPGEGLGMLIGFESPLRSGRSVVALTGTTANAMDGMLSALRDPEQSPRVQGDLAILSSGRVSAFSLGSRYTVGSLPPHVWPQFFFQTRPDLLLLLLLVACAIVAVPTYWALRRRAAMRLRIRTP